MISIAILGSDFYVTYGLNPSEKHKTTLSHAWTIVGIMMPTTNPCENVSAYQAHFKDGFLHAMLPPVNTSSCPQLGLPNVATLPGYFSVTAAVCWIYPSLQHFTGSIQQGSFQEEAVGDPIPLTKSGFLMNDAGDYMDQPIWSSFSDPCIIEDSIYVPANFSNAPGGLVTLHQHTVNVNVTVTGPLRCFYGLDYVWFFAISGSEHFTYAFSPIDPLDCVPAANYTM